MRIFNVFIDFSSMDSRKGFRIVEIAYMPRGKPISTEIQHFIITLTVSGYSTRAIAALPKICQSSVQQH